ncbi:pyruvate kinase [Nitrospina sp. 32_T5]|uniref:pyruvate kinase n=1 Tax=unclassified Nitrospina TaxID=2638683 RepID=UPI003F9701D2
MKKIIVTLGPSITNNNNFIIEDESSYIFRVNGAHGSLDEIRENIIYIRDVFKNSAILLDLPGNKIRTSGLSNPIQVKKNEAFTLRTNQTTYPEFHRLIKKGDEILADDSTLRFLVEETNEEEIILISCSNGLLKNNKGLHVRGINKGLPFLFERDKKLIEIANELSIDFIGLSFVRTAKDIAVSKILLADSIEIIAKVETRSAVENLNEILRNVNYILIDRGDLSTEVGLEKVPAYQKFIVERGLFYNRRVFLATQFLKNMEDKPIPSIAEVIDLTNTFKMGAYGIQLSEETAIGKYPMECLEVIKRIIQEIDSEIK